MQKGKLEVIDRFNLPSVDILRRGQNEVIPVELKSWHHTFLDI